jgi:hypothetical protein
MWVHVGYYVCVCSGVFVPAQGGLLEWVVAAAVYVLVGVDVAHCVPLKHHRACGTTAPAAAAGNLVEGIAKLLLLMFFCCVVCIRRLTCCRVLLACCLPLQDLLLEQVLVPAAALYGVAEGCHQFDTLSMLTCCRVRPVRCLLLQGLLLEQVVVPAAASYGLEDEYRYLRPSIKRFPTGREQEALARQVGFRQAVHYEIGFGMMGCLVATK